MPKKHLLILSTQILGFLSAVLAQNTDIFVSNYPLSYFTERLLAEEVYFPVIEGDPAFWEPSEAEIAKLQGADHLFLNGASYEKWQIRVSLPLSKVVETANVFSDQFIVIENEVSHSHGSSGEHSHAGTAFTTWIDFNQAQMQLEAIRDVLIDADIASPERINGNFEVLSQELLSLDTKLRSLTQGHSELLFIASHPIYQYFARRYTLNISAVHWEPDVYPSEELWAELERVLLDHPARWFIWEAEPLAESVERLAEMGLTSIVFDPLGNRPEQGDFLTVMKRNIENLRTVFESE